LRPQSLYRVICTHAARGLELGAINDIAGRAGSPRPCSSAGSKGDEERRSEQTQAT
jgi:hypothetical protein